MDIIKIIIIGIIGVIATHILKATSSPVAAWITIATGVIILIFSMNSLSKVFVTFNELVDKTNIDSEMYSILLKIIGIGYITEYSVSICEDLDCSSIGKKISFAGKIAIFILSIPIVEKLFGVLIKLL